MLRGMRVLPKFQPQGIGTEILEEVRSLLNDTECFAIAYAHLKDFYGRIGFRDSNEREAPAFLRRRINKYRAENPQQTFVLIRKASESRAATVDRSENGSAQQHIAHAMKTHQDSCDWRRCLVWEWESRG